MKSPSLSRLLRSRLLAIIPQPNAASTTSICPRPIFLMAIREGHRELINLGDVRVALRAAAAAAALGECGGGNVAGGVVLEEADQGGIVAEVNFDKMDLVCATEALASARVIVGVHGAALTNMVFLDYPSALVEILISNGKTEYYFLSLSLGRFYFEHPHIVPTDTHLPDPRQRRVTVDKVDSLGRLSQRALETVCRADDQFALIR